MNTDAGEKKFKGRKILRVGENEENSEEQGEEESKATEDNFGNHEKNYVSYQGRD